jgi:hypothetical protein
MLQDLSARYSVPPVAFCSELARQMVLALARQPHAQRVLAIQAARALAAVMALQDLKAQGVRLRVAGGVLRAGPPERLTPEVRQAIRANREFLLALLEG